MKRISIPVLLATLLLAACGGDAPVPDADGLPGGVSGSAEDAVIIVDAESADHRYPTRTGIIETRSDMMGETTITEYFDDYGARTARYTVIRIAMMGTESLSRTAEIQDGGWMISYDLDEKRGTKRRVRAGAIASGSLTFPVVKDAEEATRLGMESIESRTVLGREADGFEMTVMGMRMRGWVWEGVPLYTEIYMREDGEPAVLEVVSLQLDATVENERFLVPDDVVLEEI